MPRCQQTELSGLQFVPCKNEATEVLWCPTWITSNEGPMNLCEHHAKNFKPEHNPMANGGDWHWGADAYDTFQRVRKAWGTKS